MIVFPGYVSLYLLGILPLALVFLIPIVSLLVVILCHLFIMSLAAISTGFFWTTLVWAVYMMLFVVLGGSIFIALAIFTQAAPDRWLLFEPFAESIVPGLLLLVGLTVTAIVCKRLVDYNVGKRPFLLKLLVTGATHTLLLAFLACLGAVGWWYGQ
jgi:hypothetical protein